MTALYRCVTLTEVTDEAETLAGERDEHRKVSEQLRALRNVLIEFYPIEPAVARSGGLAQASSLLERVPLPKFCGAPERFHAFHSEFMDLTRSAGYSEAIWLAQLRRKLNDEGRRLLEGHITMDGARKELRRR